MVCRVCLDKSEFEISIFDEDASEQHIANVIQKHLWFTPARNDAISTLICLECWKVIRDFNEFYETVERKHKFFNDKCSSSNLTSESAGYIIEDIKVEYIDETDATCKGFDNEDSIKQTNADRKPGSGDDVPLEDVNDVCKSGSKALRSGKRLLKKPPKSGLRKKSSQFNKTKNLNAKHQNRSWSNAESKEFIRKHLNLNCDICSYPTASFGDLQNHFEAAHAGNKAYIKCCGRRFNNKQRVAQHAYLHENPNFFQCDICEKTFASAYSLRSHRTAYHPTEKELIFQCDKCEKRFPRQHLLDYHKAKHVPVEERKYLCSHCQKTFASDHLLKQHISINHTRATNVCHICAKTIRDKQAFEKHVRLHFEESGPRVKCPQQGCDKYLKDEENLKVHLRRHKQETKSYSCEQCGKIVKSRIALTSHKNYAHIKAEFNCNLCSKTFKRKISLQEHMASHLGEPLYKCPFCSRTFNSNANMHSHKKKKHPIEWENWRKTKTTSAQSTIDLL